MKKMFRLSLLLLLGAPYLALQAQNGEDISRGVNSDVTGRTFFTIRPPFQAASPEQISLFRGWGLKNECGIGGALQIVGFGGQSTDHKGLARYFMFGNKTELIVASDSAAAGVGFGLNADNGIGRDVNALHFNIRGAVPANDSFRSTIRFRPRQTFAGVGLQYRQYLGWNECCERTWWLDLSMPIVWAKNDIRLTETLATTTVVFTPAPAVGNAGAAAANMVQAFKGNNPFAVGGNWLFGKIDPDENKRSKVRLADIELKIGYDWVCTDCCYADSYIGVLIPTGNKPKGEFVFETIIGNNFHPGILTGGSLGYLMWSGECDRELWFAFDINSRYLFPNTQTRSFDLFGKPWSRYMAVWASPAAAAAGGFENLTNGINIFTRKVKVHPRFATNFTSALVFHQCSLQAELGYNFYARQSEKVRFKEPWVEGPILACLNNGTVNSPVGGSGNRAITIGANFFGSCVTPLTVAANVTAVTIRAQDIDINTAASPCAISHTVYGALGYCFDACNWPIFVGVGGSYEFSGVNTILNRWMAWGKIGFAF